MQRLQGNKLLYIKELYFFTIPTKIVETDINYNSNIKCHQNHEIFRYSKN